jgi:lysophospholipase L1-like esterase
MSRLPVPGSDNGVWGIVLNDFLSVVHSSDGTLVGNSVGESQLATGSVTTAALAEGSISSPKLMAGSVTTAAIADGSISNGKLQDGSVTTAAIADGSISNGKLQDGSVTSEKIAGLDAAVEFLQTDPDSATSTALNATYGAAFGGNRAGRLVCLGDSIARAGDNVSGGTVNWSDSFSLYCALLSQGTIDFVYNAGVGGNTTQNMIDRFGTDVTPHRPTVVTINGGTNDFTFAVTSAQFRANIKTLVAKVRAIGALPVLLTMPPVGGAAAPQKLQIVQNNMWIMMYAQSIGIPCVDMYGIVTDPATGSYLSALDNGDGIHPNTLGHYKIGQVLATTLGSYFARIPRVTRSNVDPSNALGAAGGNGLLLASTSGLATGFPQVADVSSGTAVNSLVTDTLVTGNMQRMAFTDATGARNLRPGPAVGLAGSGSLINENDIVRLTLVVTNTGGMQFQASIQSLGGGAQLTFTQFVYPVTRGIVVVPDFTVPVGASNLLIGLTATANPAPATGTCDFGQVTLTNLTTGGLITL